MDPTPNVPPAQASPVSSNPPVRPAAPSKKRGRLFYLGLAGLILGATCCLLSVVLLIVAASMQFRKTPLGTPMPDTLPVQSSPVAGMHPAAGPFFYGWEAGDHRPG